MAWLFAAPHDSELRELMNAKVGFDPDLKSKDATMMKAGGGEAPQESGGQTASDQTATRDKPSTANGQSAVTAASTVVAPTPATDAAVTKAAATPTPGSPDAYTPTLLRGGEDTQSQQMQGAPIPNKKPK